jgi:type VI secretion system secreted protein VgrG
VRHDAHDDTHLVSSGGGAGYRNALSLIPVARTWRNPAPRPRTALPGVQSAIVTGPQGEEVHCDEYGRIRLRFLWDRKGERDDRSSCWVRVAQPWAGKGRGFWALPRIGDEVLVAFVDGDADRPVVIGSLYNAEADPPFPLPANATQTGILTRSSKGGARSNANMLRFEDKKGSEEVALTAERDLTVDVERDATETVKRNRSATVAEGDDTLEVRQGDISVKAAAGTITLEAAQRITLKVGSTEVVLDQMSVSIKTGQVSVKGDMMVRVESGGNLIEKAGAIVQVNGALIKLN